ncbi:hypothetical protein FRC08_014824 [Ceratobasidium sp. 394]|nr:hypothetical protein FRC08_014824 [Ceratobasidium sp. 394]
MSATSTPILAAPSARRAPDHQRFQALWTVRSRFQQGTLCSVAVSTGGIWLASASLDCNLLFIDFRTGQLIGVLKFENQFYASSLLWNSDSSIYIGGSNGVLYEVDYVPVSKAPITLRTLPLKTLNAPICALAVDPLRNLLAVGYGGETSIFSRPIPGSGDSWDLLDHIPAPCEGPHGLVTSLGFIGTSLKERQLFIGHAKAGFCMWHAARDYQRTPYDADGTVCSIGSAAFSADGKFIAIATLDHSLVIYPMSQNGPAIHQRQVLPNQEQSGYRPIIPIALAANNIVLRGSTSGGEGAGNPAEHPIAMDDRRNRAQPRVHT